ADLSDVINEGEFVPGTLVSKVDGKLLAGTFTGKIKPGFWYSKSFFGKYGLTVPQTWDELVTLLQKIKMVPGIEAPIASGNGTGWPLSDVTEHFLISFGGPALQKDLIAGNVKWESNIVKGIFEKLVFLLKSEYFSEPAEWTTILKQWEKGEYALYFMGSWITGMV
ncbi:MAG: extracellular solute-binding protein, partial [Proteobacteria bacterium]|nr:extracellular solute-binding protein [Pseudomonadota bacterium]